MPASEAPLRVMLTNKKRGWNGEAAYILYLARGLAERGHKVALGTRKGSELRQRLEALDGLDFMITDLDYDHKKWFLKPGKYWQDAKKLRQLAVDSQAQLLHCNASWDTWVTSIALRKLGLPCIRTRHMLKPIKGHFANRHLYQKRIQHIIAASHTIKASLEKSPILVQERVHLIQYGIPLKRFNPEASKRKEHRPKLLQQLGGDEPDVVFAFISRLARRKNPRFFVDAAQLYLADPDAPPARFLLIGPDHGTEDALKELAAGQPRIHFLGFRNDVPDLLSAIDAFALCSTEEPFGLAAVEAMAMECPVILARRGGFLEMIEDGVTGDFFEIAEDAPLGEPNPAAARSLYEKMRALATDLETRKAWARKAREVALERFNVERMVDETVALYRRILAGTAG